ncbi:MAG: RidA family protein [Hyphomicrobiales bacterium]|nr:RidA family protein [Hyphomicrobiales bacterium]MDE2016328.1 RidA family protein [Hyphomicrobiales bacterium]
MEAILPDGWERPKGYANGMAGEGRFVFVGGQIGWNARCEFETDDFVAQLRQALDNVLAVVRKAGGGPEHVASMTWYLVDRRDYLAALAAVGRVWREVMGRNYPAMAVVEVTALMEPRAKVEVQAVALLPVAR